MKLLISTTMIDKFYASLHHDTFCLKFHVFVGHFAFFYGQVNYLRRVVFQSHE